MRLADRYGSFEDVVRLTLLLIGIINGQAEIAKTNIFQKQLQLDDVML
jgi:hypothetical protein